MVPAETPNGETKQLLIECTGEILRKEGMEGLTTQKVADASNKSQSLVHYHFDTKEDLITSYIKHHAAQFEDAYKSHLGDTPTERLKWFLSIDPPEDSQQSEGSVQFELHNAARHNEKYRKLLNELEELGREFIEETLTDGIKTGEFEDVDIEATATFLLAAHDGGLLRTIQLDRQHDIPSFNQGLASYVEAVLGVENFSFEERSTDNNH